MQRSVNAHVGQRVRQRRWEVGMTLQQLSDRVGITAQQIMKIEAGTNEIGASQMRDIAAALEVPASFFSEGFAKKFNSVA
ncbi:MAG: helix-turn-helix domain-containing protein [Thermohalobaculum sp.]